MAAPSGKSGGNQKTNPEQTLYVPVVFRNRLTFGELAGGYTNPGHIDGHACGYAFRCKNDVKSDV
jgi:hypothetical protein